MNAYFGEPWDAPITEGQRREPTPIGVPCMWCQVPVAEGDRGILMGYVGMGEGGERTATTVPYHRECLMRSTVGSPAHLDGHCTCHGGDAKGPQTPEELRAEALEVWRRITRE